MFNFLIKGGPIMIPIMLGSIFGLTIAIERFWVFRHMKLNTFEFVQEIFKNLKANKAKDTIQLCDINIQHPLAVVFKVGIERRQLPLNRLEKILEQVGNNQVQKLEKHLGALVSIINIEPLLGFLGTITGLIRAFMSWEKAGANVTVSLLAGGIYEAMITTAAGLIIAIPLYLCYHYFISRIKITSSELTNHSIQLLEVIAETQDKEEADK
ncbi:MAG: MotA/TolQ/ExbB proton channel family protein [Candidatus Omnitrophica bacterium]|nr:MotA/TolQ/ExbB proton channel family protein [Candidatus Omnitrophota bacterium]